MFDSEFMALHTTIVIIEGLMYKLCRMDIPLDGATSVVCNNEAVVKSTTTPELPLKKKHMVVSCHCCGEALAAAFVQLTKVHTKTNLVDTLTKPLAGPQMHELLSQVLC
jgi:hypothetical protein